MTAQKLVRDLKKGDAVAGLRIEYVSSCRGEPPVTHARLILNRMEIVDDDVVIEIVVHAPVEMTCESLD